MFAFALHLSHAFLNDSEIQKKMYIHFLAPDFQGTIEVYLVHLLRRHAMCYTMLYTYCVFDDLKALAYTLVHNSIFCFFARKNDMSL